MNEISDNKSSVFEKNYQITTKIVLIQIFSAIILMFVGWFLASQVDNSVSPNAVTGLWIALVATLIFSFLLNKFLFNWQRLQRNYERFGTVGILQTLQQNTIILFVLGQIVVITGFLIATLTVNKIEILRTGAMALIVFLFNFPRKTIWKKIISTLEQA